jgi:MFS family permease
VFFPRQNSERWILGTLFFVQAHANALWYVPFSTVLQSHALGWLTPYAFATTAVAAFFSPMVGGTLADRHIAPAKLLRYLALGISAFLWLSSLLIEKRVGGGWVLLVLQIQQIWCAPAWGLTSMMVLSRLSDPGRQFGPLRAWATYGWMSACWIISLALNADESPNSGYCSAIAWLLVAALTYLIPADPSQARTESAPSRWRDLFGLETFAILQNARHRAVFLTAGLLSIPLAAFYPFVPLHLHDLGYRKVSVLMSLGQVTEALAMYGLAAFLKRWRLRSVFILALGTCVARYGLFASDCVPGLIAGIALHGVCFAFFFVPTQIYIEQRIERSLRFRAQGLLTLLISGFGNLFGYLGCGAWRAYWTEGGHTAWQPYWLGLGAAVLAVGVYFFRAYGRATQPEAEMLVVGAADPSEG